MSLSHLAAYSARVTQSAVVSTHCHEEALPTLGAAGVVAGAGKR